MKKILVAVIFAGMLISLTAQGAYAVPQLTVTTDADPQVEWAVDEDPWFDQSAVTEDSAFNVLLNNNGGASLTNVALVLAIPYATTAGSWSIVVGLNTYTWGSFASTAAHDNLPANLYGNDKSRWFDLSLDDLSAYSSIPTYIQVMNAPVGFMLHFDGLGFDALAKKGKGDWVKNPASHDVLYTAAPEPVSSALFLLGGTLLAVRQYRKRRKA